jgi:hypothetical protein
MSSRSLGFVFFAVVLLFGAVWADQESQPGHGFGSNFEWHKFDDGLCESVVVVSCAITSLLFLCHSSGRSQTTEQTNHGDFTQIVVWRL